MLRITIHKASISSSHLSSLYVSFLRAPVHLSVCNHQSSQISLLHCFLLNDMYLPMISTRLSCYIDNVSIVTFAPVPFHRLLPLQKCCLISLSHLPLATSSSIHPILHANPIPGDLFSPRTGIESPRAGQVHLGALRFVVCKHW
jgi:hypothetical protein